MQHVERQGDHELRPVAAVVGQLAGGQGEPAHVGEGVGAALGRGARSSSGSGRHSGSRAARTMAAASASSQPVSRTRPSPVSVNVKARLRRARASARASAAASAVVGGGRVDVLQDPCAQPAQHRPVRTGRRSRSASAAASATTSASVSSGSAANAAPITWACSALIWPAASAASRTGRASSTRDNSTNRAASWMPMRSRCRNQTAVEVAPSAAGQPSSVGLPHQMRRDPGQLLLQREHRRQRGQQIFRPQRPHRRGRTIRGVGPQPLQRLLQHETIFEHAYDKNWPESVLRGSV